MTRLVIVQPGRDFRHGRRYCSACDCGRRGGGCDDRFRVRRERHCRSRVPLLVREQQRTLGAIATSASTRRAGCLPLAPRQVSKGIGALSVTPAGMDGPRRSWLCSVTARAIEQPPKREPQTIQGLELARDRSLGN